MRLEGWNIMVLLVMVVTAAVVVLAVTLLVRWTLRLARRRENEGFSA
jgi:Flp pilus assembly protein TadB